MAKLFILIHERVCIRFRFTILEQHFSSNARIYCKQFVFQSVETTDLQMKKSISLDKGLDRKLQNYINTLR